MRDILYPLRCLHGALFEEQQRRKTLRRIQEKIRTTPSDTILFVLTPTHGNLGDHAIAEASAALLKNMRLNFTEVTTAELHLLKRYHKLSLLNSRPIMVNGGGNLGTLWPNVEALFRAIIQNAPDSPILCLPNTIYYEDTPAGQQELEQSMRIYNVHNRLLLCAREDRSYQYMREKYQNVILIPDMALSLNKCLGSEARSGCILCLRNDIERTRTEDEDSRIWAQARMLFGDRVRLSDMNIGQTVPVERREYVLAEKYAEFRSAELVITDRLHGMIFASITGTPCIVVDSRSPKVRGCFQWVKDLGYVRFAESAEEIGPIYDSIKGTHMYCTDTLAPYFEELKTAVYRFLCAG